MNKKYIKLYCCLIFILIFTSCNNSVEPLTFNEVQAPDIYLDFTKENDKVYIEDNNAKNIFIDTFQVKNINDSLCYLVDNKLNVNAYCSDDINYNDVKNFELYFTKVLVLKQYGSYPIPYGELYNKRIKYDSCILRIFANDKLLVYDKYDFNTNVFEYYENMSININSRNYNDNYSLNVMKKINKEVSKNINIITLKPFKGYVIMFKIITNEKLDNDAIELIKEIIETNLANRNDINSYVGIVVEISTNTEKYAEFTYINGTNKRWSNEKWENIDFVQEAMSLQP